MRRARSFSTRRLVAYGLVVAIASLSACSDDPFAGRFEASTENVSAGAQPLPEEGSPYGTSLGLFCSEIGPARLTSVRAHRGDEGFEITSFASRVPTPPNLFGDVLESFESAGVDDTRRTIASCDRGRSEVVLQLTRRGDGPAAARGFEITWAAEEGETHTYVPYGVLLCDADSAIDVPRCDSGRLVDQVGVELDRLD